jgi:hypothetical protein
VLNYLLVIDMPKRLDKCSSGCTELFIAIFCVLCVVNVSFLFTALVCVMPDMQYRIFLIRDVTLTRLT